MSLIDLINSGTNVSFTITAKDLHDVINYTVCETRKELEQLIADERSEVYMSPNEVSEMLNVSLTTLWRWSKRGYLIPLEIGGKRKYKKSDVKKKLLTIDNII